jgi:hypothetical protein
MNFPKVKKTNERGELPCLDNLEDCLTKTALRMRGQDNLSNTLNFDAVDQQTKAQEEMDDERERNESDYFKLKGELDWDNFQGLNQ